MDDFRAGMLLRTLVADEPPPSRVDGRRAIIGAKRRRRRRRAGFVLSGVLVVVLGVAASVLPVLREEPASVALAPAEFNLSPKHAFDPTRFALELGWRPEGVTAVEQESAGSYQRITLLRTVNGALAPLVTISAYGTGQVEPDPERAASYTASIYDNGQPSHWMPRMGARPGQLWWFWGPIAWAVVEVHDDSPDAPELAIRLARALRTDRSAPVRMPITVPAPAGLKLAGAATMTGQDGLYAVQLKFAREPRYAPMSWVTVAATNEPGAVKSGAPYVLGADRTRDARIQNALADYRAAARPTRSDLVTAVPWNYRGDRAKPLLDRAATRRLATAVTLVDDPGNPKNWTRPFVR